MPSDVRPARHAPRPSTEWSAAHEHAPERGRRIDVLIVEDRVTDAMLMEAQLRRAGLNVDVHIVDSEPDFRTALAEARPDVIITDYELPRFSGPAAIRIVREQGLDIPIILATGAIEEETAIRVLSMGADDYVLKDHLMRLVPSMLAALDRAEARARVAGLNEILERSLQEIYVIDAGSLTLLDANRGARGNLGYDAAELAGMTPLDLVPDTDRERLLERFGRLRDSGDPFTFLTTHRRKDGSLYPVESHVEAGELQGRAVFVALVLDVTEREALQRQHDRLITAVQQGEWLVMITDTEGVIEYVNPAFTRMTGYPAEEALGRKPSLLGSGLHPPAFYERMWAELKQGRAWTAEFLNRKRSGEVYRQFSAVHPVKDADGEVASYVCIGRDVTREHEMDLQLRESQKMAAVGQLTSGIAHDFNNLLTVVLGNASLLQEIVDAEPRVHESLETIEKAALRGADLVRDVLGFSKQTAGSGPAVDLTEVLREAGRVFQRLLPEDVTLVCDAPAAPLPCLANENSLQQVLLNLVINARDAMPEGGTLELHLAAEETTGAATITVRDTGCGMDHETLDRVFEPFFTTKGHAGGTGLGMPMVQRLMDEMGGIVEVASTVGEGTTVSLSFQVDAAAG